MNRKNKKEWKFKEAEPRFGEIFRLARTEGPQEIVRNDEGVVVLSSEEFEWLIKAKGGKTLVEFFAQSPLAGSGINLERTPEFGRNTGTLEIE